jgi:hypothetical protein
MNGVILTGVVLQAEGRLSREAERDLARIITEQPTNPPKPLTMSRPSFQKMTENSQLVNHNPYRKSYA